MIPMQDVLVWCAAAFTLGMVYAVIAPLVYAVGSAVRTARWYYRTHPEAEAPLDRLWVRVGLWGIR